jgi:hypothetical protein
MSRSAGLFGRGGRIRANFTIHVWGLGYSRVEVHVPEYDIFTRQVVFATCTEDGRAQLMIGLSMKVPASPRRINPALALLPKTWVASIASGAAMKGFIHDVEQDFDIWQNKTFVERPVLASGDGPVVRYRRWARQFYV